MPEMPKKKYVVTYFRLKDSDFKAVGCTEAEMAEVAKLNTQLDELLKKEEELGKEIGEDGAPKELSKEDRLLKRELHEKLYVKFLDAADRKPKAWEYKPSMLPVWAQSTGSIEVMDSMLYVHGDNLPLADKVRMLKRRMVTLKAKSLAKEDRDNVREKPYILEDNEKGVRLTNVVQDKFQNSGNGCWSVSTSLLIKSRGVDNVNQTDVRAFRPNYTGDEIRTALLDEGPTEKEQEKGITAFKMSENNSDVYKMMQEDLGNNIIDRGDAFLSLAPNSMLQGIQINGYDMEARRAGLTKEQYLKNAERVVREHIEHALRDEKSPVSFLSGGHYITVVGIDKNGNLEYKDSLNREDGKGPNESRYIPLKSLLLRLTNKRPLSITMNWAADINLSKDGKTLYGVPSEYLSVGDDGKLIRPDVLKAEDNLINTYQKKEGTNISRKCFSEDPDITSARDAYLRNNGVNLTQMAYLPEKLDIVALKNKAENRSLDEEKALQEVSEKVFNVKYDPKAPKETQASMNEKYVAKQREFRDRPKDYVISVVESAKEASRKAGLEDNNQHIIGSKNAEYINKDLADEMKKPNLKEFEKKMILCKGMAAAKFEAEGRNYDAKAIDALAEKFRYSQPIDMMEVKEVEEILKQPNQVAALTAAYRDVEVGNYKVEPVHYDGYFRELQTLKENMMTKEGRSKEYGRYFDAIDNAAKLGENRNDPDLDVKIAKANKEILESVEAYTKGKKSVRHSPDGQARFDNSLDGLSIVGVFAPRGCKERAEKLLARTNEVRGYAKTSSQRLIMNDFGGENAKAAAARRNHLQAAASKK